MIGNTFYLKVLCFTRNDLFLHHFVYFMILFSPFTNLLFTLLHSIQLPLMVLGSSLVDTSSINQDTIDLKYQGIMYVTDNLYFLSDGFFFWINSLIWYKNLTIVVVSWFFNYFFLCFAVLFDLKFLIFLFWGILETLKPLEIQRVKEKYNIGVFLYLLPLSS